MLDTRCIHTFKKSWLFLVGSTFLLRCEVKPPPERSISFKTVGHVASVHFVRKYLLLLLLLLLLQLLLFIIIIIFKFVIRVVYRQEDVVHKDIITLPFLSANHIQSMFARIKSLVSSNGKMCKLINYVCQLWMEYPMFVPHLWTVYNITVCFSPLLCHSFLTLCMICIRAVFSVSSSRYTS